MHTVIKARYKHYTLEYNIYYPKQYLLLILHFTNFLFIIKHEIIIYRYHSICNT